MNVSRKFKITFCTFGTYCLVAEVTEIYENLSDGIKQNIESQMIYSVSSEGARPKETMMAPLRGWKGTPEVKCLRNKTM